MSNDAQKQNKYICSNVIYIYFFFNTNKVFKNVLICDIMNITYESITQISRLQYMYFMVLQNNIRHDYIYKYMKCPSFVSTYMCICKNYIRFDILSLLI